MSRVALADRLAPEVPSSIGEVRERLESLLEDFDVLITRSDGRSFARALKFMRAEVQVLIAYYGETKPPTRNPKDMGWRQKNREDGTRFCPKCKQWKPNEDYDYKDRRKGVLRSHCRPCWKEYQRERYVAANKRAIVIDLIEGDECVGAVCLTCLKVFVVGDRVLADGIRHVGCAE